MPGAHGAARFETMAQTLKATLSHSVPQKLPQDSHMQGQHACKTSHVVSFIAQSEEEVVVHE